MGHEKILYGYVVEVRHRKTSDGSVNKWMKWETSKVYRPHLVDNAIDNLTRDWNNISLPYTFEFKKRPVYVFE